MDKRGQIVIPKEIRQELGIDETSGLWVFALGDDGILLKKIEPPILGKDDPHLKEIREKADALQVKKKHIERTVEAYRRKKKGGLDII